jgi:hypothetical protein
MPAFARTIGIDYSGVQTPTASLIGLRAYLAEGDAPPARFRRRRRRRNTGRGAASPNSWSIDWQKCASGPRWNIPAGLSAVVEVYPTLWSRTFAREEHNGDQHDAYSAAAWMRRADLDGSLAAFLNPSLATPERAVAQVEGWILGVA